MTAPGDGSRLRIGVVSDTHGLLPPAALAAFEGVDLVLHAGDVGEESVIEELSAVAPVTAVAGNMDCAPLAHALPAAATVDIGVCRALVVHQRGHAPRPLPDGVRLVVTGHTHRAVVRESDGVLFVNPGSVSRPSGGPGTVALVDVTDGRLSARIVEL
ncbi:MAG: hypothetical protein C0418_02740 [Coriobacteriaceae bacterium]|nr:hypothetical protein [Coriobacteriaceae bacterium]